MTSNVDRPGTQRISRSDYLAQLDLVGGVVPQRPTRPAPRRDAQPVRKRGAKKGTGAAKKPARPAVRLAAVGLTPADQPTRGPWTVSVECLEGRPLTVNQERSGAMSFATFKLVRDAQAAWKAAFVEAILHAGVPELTEAHVTLQPFYPHDVVPDTDGLAPIVKSAIDSLVESGVLANDRRAQLPLGFLMLPPVSDGGLPRVAMTVHPLSAR